MTELRAREIPMIESELSEADVLRVLEARPRIRIEESREAIASRPVVRELVPPTRSANVAAPKPLAPVKSALPPAPVAKPREERDSLADTLNELRRFAFDLESDDTGSTTGVRHLQVEMDKPSSSRKRR